MINLDLVNLDATKNFWASTGYNSERAWKAGPHWKRIYTGAKTGHEDESVRCVRR